MLCWPRTNEGYRKNFFGNQFILEEGVSSMLFSLPGVCSASLDQLCLESTAQSRLKSCFFLGPNTTLSPCMGFSEHREGLTSASLEEFVLRGSYFHEHCSERWINWPRSVPAGRWFSFQCRTQSAVGLDFQRYCGEKSHLKRGLDKHINNKYLNCYMVDLLFLMQIWIFVLQGIASR